jgi:hypothetical protein
LNKRSKYYISMVKDGKSALSRKLPVIIEALTKHEQ